MLIENGYPLGFIGKHNKGGPSKTMIGTVPKLNVFLRLPFRGDEVTEQLERRLTSSLKRVYYAAKPIFTYATARVPLPPIKVAPSPLTKSNVLYKFQCSCSADYLGRTERQLRSRMAEHIPVWLKRQMSQPENDQTTSCPTDANHPLRLRAT